MTVLIDTSVRVAAADMKYSPATRTANNAFPYPSRLLRPYSSSIAAITTP